MNNVSNSRTNYEQFSRTISEKVRTASLYLNFTGSYEKKSVLYLINPIFICKLSDNLNYMILQSSISLMDLSLECLSTTSGKHTQEYLLTPPYIRAGVRYAVVHIFYCLHKNSITTEKDSSCIRYVESIYLV